MYDIDVLRYKAQGRWITAKDTDFAELGSLLETCRNGLARGLPTNWYESFALVSTQKDHQVDLRLYVKNSTRNVWNLAKLEGNDLPKVEKGPWKQAIRYAPASSNADKVQFIERWFSLQPLESTAYGNPRAIMGAWSERQLSRDKVEEWESTGAWLDVVAMGTRGRDFIDYLLNDPRAGELPVDWKERIRWHTYANKSSQRDESAYTDLYVDTRPAGETRSIWHGVRMRNGDQQRDRCDMVGRRQLEFLKSFFFKTEFVSRPLSEQLKICELGEWEEEYCYDKEVSVAKVAGLRAAGAWMTRDEPRSRGSFRGFHNIAAHLAKHGETVDERWKNSFAFVRVERRERPGNWRYFMVVYHRGTWRECGVRTRAKRHKDGSLMPKQNHKMSWTERGEFVRLWLNSSHG